jgi:uncharacterized protein (TIGR00725 family)
MSTPVNKTRSTRAKTRQPVISVIGAGKCSKKLQDLAETVGREIAASGAVLLCGGLGGVMEAAARGAKEAKGTTIGILPSDRKADANEFIDFVIVTGMGEGRNMLVAKSADAVIALPGKYGTLTEMAFALLNGIPVISVSAWKLGDEVQQVEDPVEAVKVAVESARKRICG